MALSSKILYLGKFTPSPSPLTKDYEDEPLSKKYLLGLSTILYYTGFLPFRLITLPTATVHSLFETSPKSIKVELRRNGFQIGFCMSIHIILLCTLGIVCYGSYEYILSQGRSLALLEAAMFTLGPSISLYFMYTAWWHSEWFQWLLLESSPFSFQSGGQYTQFEKLQNWMSISSPIVSMIHVFIMHHQFYSILLGTSFPFGGGGGFPGILKDSLIMWIAGIHIVAGHMMNLIFQGVALCFRDRARMFLQTMDGMEGHGAKGSSVPTPETELGREESVRDMALLGRFVELETYVNGLNERFGGWILFTVIFSIPFYSTKLVELLKGTVPLASNLFSILYIFSIIFWLNVMANCSSQICLRMKTWLHQAHAKLSCQQLNVFMSKVTMDGVAVRGGNFFLVSHSLIGTLVGFVITWTFIDQNNNHLKFDEAE